MISPTRPNTRRNSSSAPGADRISMTWRKVRAFAVQMMSVLRPIGARRRKAEVISFLTANGRPSSSTPSAFRGLSLKLLELLD